MEELVSAIERLSDVIENLYTEVATISIKLDTIGDSLEEIKGDSTYNSISDIHDKLDSIQGIGPFSNISDICDKLDEIDTSITIK